MNDIIKSLPQTTGVYEFLDEKHKRIYIGKAINIRSRVKQHLDDKRSPKERAIQQSYKTVTYHEARSEFEALLLEARLVQKYQPKYNIELRDDKSPLYIVVTSEEYPKVHLVRLRDLSGKEKYVFGPQSSVRQARFLVTRIRRIVPFCTEKSVTKKSCFYSQVGLCDPCPNDIVRVKDAGQQLALKKIYKDHILKVTAILKGRGRAVLAQLYKEMKVFSKEERFEEAGITRDRIQHLEELFRLSFIGREIGIDPAEYAKVAVEESEALRRVLGLSTLARVECFDVSTFSFKNSTASMVVFDKGIAVKGQYRRFRIRTKETFDPVMLAEVVVRRLGHKEWDRPDLIVLDGGGPQLREVYNLVRESYPDAPYIVGIAKRPDRLTLPDRQEKVTLERNSPALLYLERMRDEAHRFAKKYHTLLRKKDLFGE